MTLLAESIASSNGCPDVQLLERNAKPVYNLSISPMTLYNLSDHLLVWSGINIRCSMRKKLEDIIMHCHVICHVQVAELKETAQVPPPIQSNKTLVT